MTTTHCQPRALLVVVGEARTVLAAGGAGEAALHDVPPVQQVPGREEGEGVRPHLHCSVQTGGQTGAGAHNFHNKKETKKHITDYCSVQDSDRHLPVTTTYLPHITHNEQIVQWLNK